GEDEGAQVIRRLRLFGRLDDLDLPIVLLIGGATGTGKSTVATEIAYRLGITRVTSTDFVRQTMRAFFSQDFMPAIHYSSFEAGEARASHFWLRASASGSARPFERYLDSLGDIREIQDYIVGRAEKAGVRVIENGNIELAIGQAMELVLESAERFEKVG